MGCTTSTASQTKAHAKTRKTERDKERRNLAEQEANEKRRAEDDFTANLVNERKLLSLHASFMMKLRGSYTGRYSSLYSLIGRQPIPLVQTCWSCH